MRVLTEKEAVRLGYPRDRRKRRRAHRAAARELQRTGRGSICAGVVSWHLAQARAL